MLIVVMALFSRITRVPNVFCNVVFNNVLFRSIKHAMIVSYFLYIVSKEKQEKGNIDILVVIH